MELEITSDIDRILDGLNPEQAECVRQMNGPMLIVAGAGSGKTKVLTHKIAYLIANGVKPWNILALTFTRKAANEMKDRISKLVGSRAASQITAGTFHSVFARQLRRWAELLDYKDNFSIYDEQDSLSIVKKIFKENNIPERPTSPQIARSIISNCKNQLIDWQKLHSDAKYPNQKTIAEVYKLYDERLRSNNAMDFDDLLWNFIRLLEQNRDVLESYQDTYRYILVDEYQDTNHAQYVAIQLLAKKYQNICVVGDDAQSIYGWRGADIKNILSFKDAYHNVKIYKLEQNYRSTQTILEAANSVIQNNSYQIKKKLFTQNEKGELIELVECDTDQEEAEVVIIKILKIIDKNKNLNDICVLYRTNAQSLELEKACRKYNIPYVIFGGMSFYKRKEVKDVLSYLRTLINPNDTEAILRIINEPSRGIGETTLKHIERYAYDHRISFFEALQEASEIDELVARAKNSVSQFVSFIEKYRKALETERYEKVVPEFVKETGLIQFYQEIGSDEAQEKIANIEQVINDIAYFAEENPESTLNDYLQQMVLMSDIDTETIDPNRLTLMTMHSAKGLEFDYVFITGMEDGLFPISRALFNQNEEEEERRLFYVGITRAKKKLWLTYAKRRMRFGEVSYQKTSSFLKEIDKSLIKHIDPQGKPITTFSKKTSGLGFNNTHLKEQEPDYSSYSQIEKTVYDFRVGDLVRHSQFGVGKITGLSGEGSLRKATVNFANFGKKLLLLQYAKLELVKQSE